ncbi:hypothetical protein PGB90_009013 [Kerria lacca]
MNNVKVKFSVKQLDHVKFDGFLLTLPAATPAVTGIVVNVVFYCGINYKI